MMSTEDICQIISCCPPHVKRLNGYILKASTKLSRCKSVKMQARNCWSRSGWTQTSLWILLTRKFDRDGVPRNTRRRSKARFKEPYLLLSQIGNHTVKSGSTLQSLTAPSVGEGGHVGRSLRSIYMDLGIPMKVEIQSDSSTAHSLTDGWEQDSERNTLTRDASGNKNEFKMEISLSRRCLQRRTVQMLERSWSLLLYNNTASLQDWYSAEQSHTPL